MQNGENAPEAANRKEIVISDSDTLASLQERIRVLAEPPPEQVAGPEFTPLVAEAKRICAEFDAIERPGEYTKERCDKAIADLKVLAHKIHTLGGTALLEATMGLYVPPGLQSTFELAFMRVGEW